MVSYKKTVCNRGLVFVMLYICIFTPYCSPIAADSVLHIYSRYIILYILFMYRSVVSNSDTEAKEITILTVFFFHRLKRFFASN